MARKFAIGVDLGATRIRVCLGTGTGKMVRRESRNMDLTGTVGDYLSQITSAVRSVMGGIDPSDIEGVCVASLGPLDLERGSIVHVANIPYKEVPIVPELRDAFGERVYLVNDANAGCLGEWLRGGGKGRRDVFYLTISTGIGGGAIVDGNLLLGKDGNAAEVGHITIDSAGRLVCGCGRRGHWEAYCSGRGIPALARLMGKDRASSPAVLGEGVGLDAATVFRHASARDPFSREVVAEVGRLNAIGVANIIDAYDPEIVTVGGGVALNNPEAVVGPIRRHVEDYAINAAPEIRMTPLGDHAGLLGALAVAFDPDLIGE